MFTVSKCFRSSLGNYRACTVMVDQVYQTRKRSRD